MISTFDARSLQIKVGHQVDQQIPRLKLKLSSITKSPKVRAVASQGCNATSTRHRALDAEVNTSVCRRSTDYNCLSKLPVSPAPMARIEPQSTNVVASFFAFFGGGFGGGGGGASGFFCSLSNGPSGTHKRLRLKPDFNIDANTAFQEVLAADHLRPLVGAHAQVWPLPGGCDWLRFPRIEILGTPLIGQLPKCTRSMRAPSCELGEAWRRLANFGEPTTPCS